MKESSKRTTSRYQHLFLRVVLSVLLAFSTAWFAGCSPARTNNPAASSVPVDVTIDRGSSDADTALDDAPYDAYTAKDGTWAFYWYACGSDIELRTKLNTTASGKILEMMEATLPDNVTVVIQAAGAEQWHFEAVDPSVTNRFVYRGNTMTALEPQPLMNMGDPETLADFLAFCNREYPAQNQVVIVYNHGGGSLYGIAFDKLFDNDRLTIPELREVMQIRPAASGSYELIAFSACLMATIDCVDVFKDHARYFLASEELQLSIGWNFPQFVTAPGKNPNITGGELGKIIADGYNDRCKNANFTKWTTVSVIDLSKADALLAAYNNVGIELLQGAAAGGSEFYAEFGRAAHASENYGSKDLAVSTYDMVDIGDLVKNASDLLPKSAGPMLRALDDAMYYHVTNPMRANGKGIACFYPYSAKLKAYENFDKLGTSLAWKYFYDYLNKGALSEEGQAYLKSLSTTTVSDPEILPAPSQLGLDGHAIRYEGMGFYRLELGDKAKYVAAVHMMVGQFFEDEGYFEVFGHRDQFAYQTEFGTFSEGYNQLRGSLDGVPCYMEVVSRVGYTTVYRVPVFHNGYGSFKWLLVEHSYSPPQDYQGSYQILGLISADSGYSEISPDMVFEKLEVGDELNMLNQRFAKEFVFANHYDGTGALYPGQIVTVTKDTSFYDILPGDGLFMVCFIIIDYTNTWHYSQNGFIRIYYGQAFEATTP